MKFVHCIWLALALGGCSLILVPDESQIRRPDGSADGGRDAGPDSGDAGRDGGPDACVMSESPHETTCSGGADEDCDGYVDCADYSCASSPECCGGATPVFEEDWNGVLDGWLELGPSVTRGSMGITSFVSASTPNAVLYADCLPLDVGVSLEVSFRVPVQCVTATCMDDYASFVLTSLPELPAGRGLSADFAVRVGSDGSVGLWRGTERLELLELTLVPGTSATATIVLTPGLAPGNAPSVIARVVVDQPGGGTAESERWPIVLLRDLEDAREACTATGNPRGDGLFGAIEGQGDAVHVGVLSAESLTCANPTLFRPSTALRTTSYALGDWAAGGTGAPSLARYLDGSREVWELWVDASTTPRDQDAIEFVWLAIGAGLTTNDGVAWTPRGGRQGLIYGESPTSEPSRREPSFYAHVDRMGNLDGSELKLVFAREVPRPSPDGGAGGPDGGLIDVTPVYELWSTQGNIPTPVGDAPPLERTTPLLRPQDAGCRSLRDPLLLPVDDDLTMGFWLVYTCEREGVSRSTLELARVPRDLTTASPQGALLALSAGFAERGVYGAEGIADFDAAGTRVTYRLWFLARDAGGVSTLGYAEAFDVATSDVPVFVPYPANPVLRPEDTVLGACDRGCRLTGATVTRANDLDLQLVISRRVGDASGGTRYELVPLLQVRQR